MDRVEPSRPTRSSAQDISQSDESTSLGRNFSSRDERLSHVDVQDQSRRESREMARYFEQSVRVDLIHSLTRTLTLLLTSRYVWIDWSSMPQPSACPPSTDKKVKEKLGTNLGKAVKSIPAYVNHFSFHTPLDSHESITREQIRREIRLCRDRGPWLSSR